ncbi:MAG TPA: GAF domain-containing protein [Candidatus Baltobacteraceae bacterium]
MDRAGSTIAVFSHDVELLPAIGAALNVAGIRVVPQAEVGAIHLMRYGDSVGVIPDPEGLPAVYVAMPIDPKALVGAVRVGHELNETRRAVREAKELLEIARLLGSEHDKHKLYSAIVLKSRELTNADSGTLFILESQEGKEFLRFAIAQTGPHHQETYAGGTIPLNNASIAGHVAMNGKPIRLTDVYKDAATHMLNFDRSFDEKNGYRTKSMLCVPLMHYTGKPTGVLQLMNRKPIFEMPLNSASITESAVEPFDKHDEELIMALASYAGVALRNAQLLEDLWATKGLEGKNPLER